MQKQTIVQQLISNKIPSKESATQFAPSNIALCKYWGKRDNALNLPVTSSLSVSLGNKGTTTTIKLNQDRDCFILNGKEVNPTCDFFKRTKQFLDLFRLDPHMFFLVDTTSTIPTAAGLASSASGFAALVLALNDFFSWNLNKRHLSILARLGSGSASRSLWQGFVIWHKGIASDGMDSFAEPINMLWPNLAIGLLIFTEQQKSISSRDAMLRTVETSPFYQGWPNQVANDLEQIHKALQANHFDLLGQSAERNAIAMHATMQTAWPPVYYANAQTITAMHRVWKLRAEGLPIYFTQDAGPNLKLIFERPHELEIRTHFPDCDIVYPFDSLMNMTLI